MLYRRFLLLLALAASISACAAGGDPTVTPQPTATPLQAEPPEEISARMARCSELRAGMEQVLKVETRPTEAEIPDPASGAMLQGCQVEATGNGREFSNFNTVAQGLDAMFRQSGWVEDPRFLAGGPTGTMSTYRKDAGFCQALVEWKPAESVRCPADQPISACNIAPEQQLYTIRISCAQAGG
jgi:hypothetical protein